MAISIRIILLVLKKKKELVKKSAEVVPYVLAMSIHEKTPILSQDMLERLDLPVGTPWNSP